MPGTKGGLVYHWRHGWIPRDHFAALQKAHGSQHGAAKIMARHNIADGPKSLHSVDRSNGGKGKPSAPSKPASSARVRSLPADGRFSGVHSETHMGERVTVKRGREFGTIETHINGHLIGVSYGTKNSDAVKHLDATKGTVEHAKANPGGYTNGNGEHSYGMKLSPKPAANPVGKDHRDMSSAEKIRAAEIMHGTGSKQHQAAQAKSGGKTEPSAPQHSAAEIARGYDMHGKAIPKAGAEPAPAAKRVHVEHSGDGTTLDIARDDVEARAAVKAAGFKYSSNLGSWYLPRTWGESTRRQKVDAVTAKLGAEHVHVNDGGRTKSLSPAEQEAARKVASAARADRLDARTGKHIAERDARYKAAHDIADRIPMGQPILVGHHSERGARADQKRIHSHSDKMVEAHKKAEYTQRLADAARKNASSEDSPLKRQRRIDKNEAEIRSIDRKLTEHGIAVKAPAVAAKVGIKPMSADHHAHLTATRSELAAQVAHDKAQIADSGHKAVTASDITPGDMVQYRGRTHIVTKVNKTTVSVPSGYSWDDKVPINQVGKHIPLSTQSDESVKAAFDKTASPKVKAALLAELKRRGLAS